MRSGARTLDRLTEGLLGARTAGGHWTGELSSSALSPPPPRSSRSGWSTAVGCNRASPRSSARRRRVAGPDSERRRRLGRYHRQSEQRQHHRPLLGSHHDCRDQRRAVPLGGFERVRNWMRRAAGSLDPRALAETISRRYGKDRTFSVPILTVLALAGLLGADERRDAEGNARQQGENAPRQRHDRGDDAANVGTADADDDAEGDNRGRAEKRDHADAASGNDDVAEGDGRERCHRQWMAPRSAALPFELAAVPPAW